MSKLLVFIVKVLRKLRANLNVYFKIFKTAEGIAAVLLLRNVESEM
jgi:hypothetical protein